MNVCAGDVGNCIIGQIHPFALIQLSRNRFCTSIGRSSSLMIILYSLMNIKITNTYAKCLNIAQVWISMVLYHRGVYPKECFNEKTVFNRMVNVAKEGPLEKYIG